MDTDTSSPESKQSHSKPVETLVLANYAAKVEQKRGGVGNGRKEDERITTAVMKVLEGYDWNLVQATAKWVPEFISYVWQHILTFLYSLNMLHRVLVAIVLTT